MIAQRLHPSDMPSILQVRQCPTPACTYVVAQSKTPDHTLALLHITGLEGHHVLPLCQETLFFHV